MRVVHPGTGSRIRILTIYPSRIQGSKRQRIPDPQHWLLYLTIFSRLVMNPSSARCHAKERARCTASRMSSSWRGRATRASASPWWAGRTRTRDPSASTSRASFPTDRPLDSSKKVGGELNYGLDQSFIADMNAHFSIFYIYVQRKTLSADYFVLYKILFVTGCFVVGWECDVIQANLVGMCCISKTRGPTGTINLYTKFSMIKAIDKCRCFWLSLFNLKITLCFTINLTKTAVVYGSYIWKAQSLFRWWNFLCERSLCGRPYSSGGHCHLQGVNSAVGPATHCPFHLWIVPWAPHHTVLSVCE